MKHPLLAEALELPLLTFEQELQLGQVMAEGQAAQALLDTTTATITDRARLVALAAAGKQAEQDLILHNLKLVIHVATARISMAADGLTLDDLIQEGMLGLIAATPRYDYRKGLRFSTFITWWIRQAIGRAVASQSRLIRLPVHAGEAVTALRKHMTAWVAQHGTEPTPEELRQISGRPLEHCRLALENGIPTTSLDRVYATHGEEGRSLGELLPAPGRETDDEAVHRDEIRAMLAAINLLPERTRTMILLYFHEGLTYEAIGLRMEPPITRERVRQIIDQALLQVRAELERTKTKPAAPVATRLGGTATPDLIPPPGALVDQPTALPLSNGKAVWISTDDAAQLPAVIGWSLHNGRVGGWLQGPDRRWVWLHVAIMQPDRWQAVINLSGNWLDLTRGNLVLQPHPDSASWWGNEPELDPAGPLPANIHRAAGRARYRASMRHAGRKLHIGYYETPGQALVALQMLAAEIERRDGAVVPAPALLAVA